jgi:CheY-like chemotaxis protein
VTILVVDDAATWAAALEVALAGIPGATVVPVRTGAAGLKALREGLDVRAVVTDLQMPKMDGFELIRTIRAEPRWRALPIVVVSADPDPEAPARTAALGANAYFSKPCSPVAVRRRVEELLQSGAEAPRGLKPAPHKQDGGVDHESED